MKLRGNIEFHQINLFVESNNVSKLRLTGAEVCALSPRLGNEDLTSLRLIQPNAI